MTKITVDKDLIEQAIEAINAAVDSWGQAEIPTTRIYAVEDALRAALAKPVVEPCVVGEPPEDLKKFFHQIIHGDFLAENPEDLSMALNARSSFYALFTAPKPPAEVPLLSDEEMMEIVTANAGYGGTKFDRVARAIEQAVRQKAGLK